MAHPNALSSPIHGSIVDIVTDDMPFLVDTVRVVMNRARVHEPAHRPPGDALLEEATHDGNAIGIRTGSGIPNRKL